MSIPNVVLYLVQHNNSSMNEWYEYNKLPGWTGFFLVVQFLQHFYV